MTKKQESMEKAKEGGKKILEGGKELGKGVVKTIGGTAKSLYYLIDAGDKTIGENIEKKQLKKGKKVGKVSKFFRDNIIKLLIAGSVVGYGGGKAIQHHNNHSNKSKQETINYQETKGDSDEVLLVPTEGYNLLKKTITTNAPLTHRYLGGDLEKSGDLVIGDTLTLNSAESLHNLRTKKIQKYGQSTKNITELDAIDVSKMGADEIENFRVKYPIDATYLFTVKPYVDGHETKEKMDLKSFIKECNKIVDNMKGFTQDYNGGLSGDKLKLFDEIRKDITGESIVAYAMTELCENKEDGEFNKQLFDFLLKNSGANYLTKIPAIYDGKTSLGLYQFTEYALYDDGKEKRGASEVNSFLPEGEKIGGSVISVQSWQDQTKAAYMFALYNLSKAVKHLTDQQAKDLLRYQKSNKESFDEAITELIAMCHHLPVDKKALRKWHEDNHKKKIYKYGKAERYGKASGNNYKALKK